MKKTRHSLFTDLLLQWKRRSILTQFSTFLCVRASRPPPVPGLARTHEKINYYWNRIGTVEPKTVEPKTVGTENRKFYVTEPYRTEP